MAPQTIHPATTHDKLVLAPDLILRAVRERLQATLYHQNKPDDIFAIH